MPFVNRRVEPLYVSNKVLPNGCSTELENVANNTLANLVRQLANIADHATNIFDEICAESRDIYDRSSRLTIRATRLEEILGTLDARAVEVRKYFSEDSLMYLTIQQFNWVIRMGRWPLVLKTKSIWFAVVGSGWDCRDNVKSCINYVINVFGCSFGGS